MDALVLPKDAAAVQDFASSYFAPPNFDDTITKKKFIKYSPKGPVDGRDHFEV
jgi:hypothetical protein